MISIYDAGDLLAYGRLSICALVCVFISCYTAKKLISLTRSIRQLLGPLVESTVTLRLLDLRGNLLSAAGGL